MSRFSAILIEHFQEPRNYGRMDNPDRTGSASLSGGAAITIHLKIESGKVQRATFEAHGCGVTIAAGSMLTEMVEGMSLSDCFSIAPEQLAKALGGVPPDKRHSPFLAVLALRDAARAT